MSQSTNFDGFFVHYKAGYQEYDVVETSPCGRYLRYEKMLGRGAFKDVYKGFDRVDKVEIAWNQISIEEEIRLNSPESLKKLSAEAVLLRSLDHKNIMKCYCYWVDEQNKSLNMITELFSSGSLRQHRKKTSNLDTESIKYWGRQILEGLLYLHGQTRIIHRDLKCDNIFLDGGTGQVKLGDFGLATARPEGPLHTPVGTPAFMAPEYYDEEYDELVDIYAFGMCLIELATSDLPYSECENPAQIFKKVFTGIKPAALAKVKDPEVKQIIEKCLVPASMRPSAIDLLKDPFFSSRTAMEIESDQNMVSEQMVEDESPAKSSLDVAFDSTESSIPVEDCLKHRGVKNHYISESAILSDISALYNSISASEDNHEKIVGQTNNLYYDSSTIKVSMNSKITFASSSNMVSDNLKFCVSTLTLSGTTHPGSILVHHHTEMNATHAHCCQQQNSILEMETPNCKYAS